MAMARMGESIEQCDERYGKPTSVSQEGMNRSYLKNGIKISCFFWNMPTGKCVYILYQNVGSAKLAETLWEANHPEWYNSVSDEHGIGLYRGSSGYVEGYDEMHVWYSVSDKTVRIESAKYFDFVKKQKAQKEAESLGF